MIRIKFRGDDNRVFETMLLEDRPDTGPQIREHKAPDCDADRSITLDVPSGHCDACCMDIADQIGLTEDEVDAISRWREAKGMAASDRAGEGLTAEILGAILDKIVRKLGYVNDTCDEHDQRIVIEVEPTP